MKRTTKHVALDVPQATTLASVREDRGRVIARTILPTEEPAGGGAVRRARRAPDPPPAGQGGDGR